MDKRNHQIHWYTRRSGVIRGPFSAGEITRHVILGRIRTDDELSRDGHTWMAANHSTDQLPDELRKLSRQGDYQQLGIARAQMDERKGKRRDRQCSNPSGGHPERRALDDRRGKGNERQLSQYLLGRSHSSIIQSTSMKNARPLLAAMLLVTVVLVWLVP
jgi:hypothetical protein